MTWYAALAVAPALLLSPPSCWALSDTTSVSASGVSATVLAEPFGFAAGGYMDFEVELSARCVLSLSLFVLFCSKTGSRCAPCSQVQTVLRVQARTQSACASRCTDDWLVDYQTVL